MKKTRISVTKASRNFADCVSEKICLGSEAARALAEVELSPAEAKAWHRDLLAARKRLKVPTDKWR